MTGLALAADALAGPTAHKWHRAREAKPQLRFELLLAVGLLMIVLHGDDQDRSDASGINAGVRFHVCTWGREALVASS